MTTVLTAAVLVGALGIPLLGATPAAADGTILPYSFVANSGDSSILEYAKGADGNIAPVAIIQGSNTGLVGPYGMAMDAAGDLFVTNIAVTYSVTEYADGASGNAAPVATISGFNTGLSNPTGVAVDGAGHLFVVNNDNSTITEYAKGADGNVAPIVTIKGLDTGLVFPTSVALDAAGDLFVANGNDTVLEYAVGASGDASPMATINTGLRDPAGLALDAAGNLFVANAGNNTITEYADANYGAGPIATITGTAENLDDPSGIALDAAGNLFVTNAGNDSVTEYAAGATSNATPVTHNEGSSTGLYDPEGVAAGAPPLAAPTITAQPSDQSVTAGQTATFTAAANGQLAPTVQWQVSTDSGTTFTDVTGATADTYTTPTTTTSMNTDQYRAVFTNATGTAISFPATLTVNPASAAPAITLQPADQIVIAGQTATFTAAASGTPAPTLQWQVSTDSGSTFTNLNGATADTLTIGNTTLIENGNEYRAVFTNSQGNATSSPATLTVSPAAPTITTQPADQTVIAGQIATFDAAANGQPAPTVQWQVSTDSGNTFANVPGATSDTLTVTGATLGESGSEYRAVFTNTAGSTTSTPATLTVSPAPAAPAVTSEPSDQIVVVGQTGTFTAGASGLPAPTVQWQVSVDGGETFNAITGATHDTLTVAGTTLGESGNEYRAVFTNTAGSSTSTPATLTVNPAPAAPTITLQPADQTVIAGQTAIFAAGVDGQPTPTVQWQVSTDSGTTFTNVTGATAAVCFIVTTTTSMNTHQYRAVFTNTAGSVTSSAATLTVHASAVPTVTGEPADEAVVVGQTATFTAGASGTPAPTLQWQVSTDSGSTFANLNGSTADTLTIGNTTLTENGNEYRAVFTNTAGSVTSSAATLTVNPQSSTVGGFTATGPTRVLDTRTGLGAPRAPVGSAGTIILTVPNLPAGTAAVVLNLTGTGLVGAPVTFVSACPAAQPLDACTKTSVLNPVAAGTIANEITVPVGPDGRITLYNNAGTINLVADLLGYVTGGFTATGPTRVLDTRTGLGAPRAPVGSAGTVILTVPNLPAGTAAVVLNLTGTGLVGAPVTFVSACPAAQPLDACTKTSVLNPVAAGTIANEITVPVGPDGRITLYNNAGQINLVADLAGYVTGGYTATGPTRILDTRSGLGAPTGPVGPAGTITLTVPNLPAGTTAVVLNLTGTGLSGARLSFVSACPAAQPLVSCTKTSALNPIAGQDAANEITVPVGPDGRITLYNNAGQVNLVADLAGYLN